MTQSEIRYPELTAGLITEFLDSNSGSAAVTA